MVNIVVFVLVECPRFNGSIDRVISEVTKRRIIDKEDVESSMGMGDILPKRMLTQQEIISLSQEESDIEEMLAVFAFEGGSMLKHYVAVLYLQTDSKRVLLGYDGNDGWMIIESIASDSQFEHDEASLRAWMDDHESKTWYVDKGGPSHASPFTFETNIANAPEFLTSS